MKPKFRGTYRGKLHYFTFQTISGNKIGIPSIDISGQLVSIHLLENIENFTGRNDNNSKELYEGDYISCTNGDGFIILGDIVFHNWCYSIKISQITNMKNDDRKSGFDVGGIPPLYEFKNIIRVMKIGGQLAL